MSQLANEMGAAAALTEASDAFGETISITRDGTTVTAKPAMFNADRTRLTIRQAVYNLGTTAVAPAHGDYYTDADGKVYVFSPSNEQVDGVIFRTDKHFISETSEWQVPINLREP